MSSVSKIKLPNNTVVDIADKISGYGKFVHLTDESDMPSTPDPNTLYLIDDDGSSGDSVVNAVLYSAQTLTSAQKAQARTNIDAQETLVGSGTGQNIKMINNQSILGSGNITVSGGGGFPSGDANKLVYVDSNGDLAASFAIGGSSNTYTFSKLQVITALEGYDYSNYSFIKPSDVNTTLQDVIDDIYNTIGDVETLLNALL